jgi:hypothetical protein
MGYLEMVKDKAVEHLNNPMPDVWSDTVGRALQEFIKGMGG